MEAGFQFLNTLEREKQAKEKPVCIVCSKCHQTARRLFFQQRVNKTKYHISTPIGYCENCNRYEIPEEIKRCTL